MHYIVTFNKHLTHMCFQSLHHRFVDWTKPSNTSLMLGMVSLFLQITMVARSSPSQSWVDCTTITAEALDL